MIDEYLIKVKIYKIDDQINISGEYRISPKNNPDFKQLFAILGEPKDIRACHCKTIKMGWKLGKITLVIED